MGYDQHQQSNSPAAVVLVVVFAVLGIFTVASVGLLFVWNSQSRAVAANELQVAVADIQRAETMAQLQELRVADTPGPKLNFAVRIDREGSTSIGGNKIDLDELRAHLTKLKGETSKAFSVHINVDSECPVKLVIPVLDVCHEVGDIDFRIVSFADSDAPSGDVTAEN